LFSIFSRYVRFNFHLIWFLFAKASFNCRRRRRRRCRRRRRRHCHRRHRRRRRRDIANESSI